MLERLALIESLTDWLAGTQLDYLGLNQGINAQLAGLTLLAGHTAPPAFVTITAETRDARVARLRMPELPAEQPCLAVNCPERFPIEGELLNTVRDADGVPLLVRMGTREVDSKLGNQWAHYWSGALERSLRQYMRNENADLRTRLGVQVHRMPTLTHLPLWELVDDVIVQAAAVPTFDLRDIAP